MRFLPFHEHRADLRASGFVITALKVSADLWADSDAVVGRPTVRKDVIAASL